MAGCYCLARVRNQLCCFPGSDLKAQILRRMGRSSRCFAGVGQFYYGRILAGILWLIITPGLWIGTGGLLGWVCHVISAYTAYSYARDQQVRISTG